MQYVSHIELFRCPVLCFQACMKKDKEYLIPIWFLKADKAHATGKACPTERFKKVKNANIHCISLS